MKRKAVEVRFKRESGQDWWREGEEAEMTTWFLA